ncbi:MAG: hypothetical protein LBL74_00965 [Bacteroidales bacterium]|jgi:hypothetical protein|nr:hypothetical protein [Bacteroidales bacterium]
MRQKIADSASYAADIRFAHHKTSPEFQLIWFAKNKTAFRANESAFHFYETAL